MNKITIVVVLSGLSLFTLRTNAQRDTLRLYFGINESLSRAHSKKIDSLTSRLSAAVYNVWIYGYADFLHHDEYNQQLSQKRADGVKARLLKNSSEPQMTIMACEGRGEKYSSDNGSAEGELKNRRVDLIYEIRGSGRVPDTRPVRLTEPKDTAAEQPVDEGPKTLETLEKGESMALEGLTFVPGRHVVKFESVPVLKNLLKTMRENPDLKIEIQGHICCSPGPEDGYDYDTDDYRLSRNRAKAVFDYLVQNGIPPARMKYRGFGHSRPKVKETNEETQQINRRVEVMILEK